MEDISLVKAGPMADALSPRVQQVKARAYVRAMPVYTRDTEFECCKVRKRLRHKRGDVDLRPAQGG